MADKILVLIAARGGSKGLKNKNIRPLAGKPLIYYTLKQVLTWKQANRVVVSTDSPQIAAVAERCGAAVPFKRPPQLATDTAPKGLVVKHALESCEKIYGETYDIVVDLDVTAPVRTVSDLDRCLKIFKRFRPKTLFSVSPARKNPYFNMVEKDARGNAKICKRPTGRVKRRQDAPRVYSMNASIYFYSRDYLMNSAQAPAITDFSKMYVMSELAGIDIDAEIDFKFIEFLLHEGVISL